MPEHSSSGQGRANPHEVGNPRTPPSIPDHEMLRCIGRGGYGEVWLARNVVGTLRAVKVVHRDVFADARPYEREFQGIQKFEPLSRTHEGLVDVLQIGLNEQAGYFFYVMELADDAAVAADVRRLTSPLQVRKSESEKVGENPPMPADSQASTLSSADIREEKLEPPHVGCYSPRTLASDLKLQGRLPFAQCLRTALALADALEHLHRHGLIHRDIKPANIIFVNGAAKLADIGLVTEQGAGKSWVGTEGFMPPEGPGTPQADVFSLGKVLYEISTGKDRKRFPEPLTSLADQPDQADWLEFNEVVEKACQSDPKQRYASAADLRADLALLLGGKSVRRLRRMERQRRYLVAVAAVVLGVGAISLGVYQHFHEQAQNQRQLEREKALSGQLQFLREARGLRSGIPTENWFTNSWAKLKEAAGLRIDDELKLEVTACLSGLDATPILNTNHHEASSVAFDAGGQRVLFGGLTNQAMIWDGRDQPLRRTGPRLERGPVTWLPDGTPAQLAPVKGNPFTWQLWDVARSNLLREFHLPATNAPDPAFVELPAAFAADGTRVAIAARYTNGSGVVCVWDLGAANLHAEHETLSTSKSQRGVALSLPPHSERTVIRAFPAAATSLALTPDGNLLAIGDESGLITVRAVTNGGEVAHFDPSRMRVHCLAFTRDYLRRWDDAPGATNWLLASGHAGSEVRVWDLRRKTSRGTYRGLDFDVYQVAFGTDSTVLVASGNHETRFWDVATEAPLLRLDSAHTTTGLALSPDSSRLVASSTAKFTPGHALGWQLSSGRGATHLRGLSGPLAQARFSPDGRWVAVLAHNWQIGLWDKATAQRRYVIEVPPGDTADNAALVFSQDGQRLAFSAGTNALLLPVELNASPKVWSLPRGYGDVLGFHRSGAIYLLRVEPANFVSYELMSLGQHPKVARLRNLALPDGCANPTPVLTNFSGRIRESLMPAEGQWFALNTLTIHGAETHRLMRVFDTTTLAVLWEGTTTNEGSGRAWLDNSERKIVTEWSGGKMLVVDPLAADRARNYAADDFQFEPWHFKYRHPGRTGLFRAAEKEPFLLMENAVATRWLSRVDTGPTTNPSILFPTAQGPVLAHLEQVRTNISTLGLGWR